MGTQFSWFYDVALIGVVIAYIYLGGKRGFLRTFVLLVGYIVSIAGAYFISDAVSPVVYDKFVKERAEEVVADNILNFSIKDQIRSSIKKQGITIEIPDEQIDNIINSTDDLSQGFSNYVGAYSDAFSQQELEDMLGNAFNNESLLNKLKEKLPESIYNKIEDYIGTSTTKITEIVRILNNPNNEERAEEITDILFRPFAVSAIKFIVFMLAFALLMIIFRFISGLFKKFYLIPIAGQINSLLGAVLGLCQGLFIIFVVTLVIKIIIALMGNDLLFINEPTIEKTMLFRRIYEFNLFK